MRVLYFLVSQPRRRTHQAADELMRDQPAVLVDPQMAGKTGAVDFGLERAEG